MNCKARSSQNFKECDELAQELQNYKGCRQQLNYELSNQQKKCKKAREYLARKEKTALQHPGISVHPSDKLESGDVHEDQVFQ